MKNNIKLDKEINEQSINILFNKIENEYLPKLIISSRGEDLNQYIKKVRKMFSILREEYLNENKINGINLLSDEFEKKYKSDLLSIMDYIDNKVDENSWIEKNNKENNYKMDLKENPKKINELIQFKLIISDLIDDGPIRLISDEYKNIINKRVKLGDLLLFDKIKLKRQIFNLFVKEEKEEINEDLWEKIAKESLKKLQKDFNFNHIYINDKLDWKKIYTWSNDLYIAIEESQKNIGIEKESTGLNNSLGLTYNPSYLSKLNADGLMRFNPEIEKESQTIFIENLSKIKLKRTWQHEYTHTMDIKCGIEYIKELKLNIPPDFLSKLVNKVDVDINNDKLILLSKKLKIARLRTKELLSNIFRGENDGLSLEKDLKERTKFNEELVELLLKELLGNEYNKLNDKEKTLLKDDDLIGTLGFVMTRKIFIHNNLNFLNELNISEIINERLNKKIDLINIDNNDLLKKIKKKINYHGVIFDVSTHNFKIIKTDSGIASLNLQSKTGNNYWLKSEELLARVSEELQDKLIIGTKKYRDENIGQNIKEYINPKINRNERILLLRTIHGFADVLGIKYNKSLKDLPSLEKELNSDEEIVYESLKNQKLETSSMLSGNEEKAKLLLKISKVREKVMLINHKKENKYKPQM